MHDPLSGAKQASTFITELMEARTAEADLEKAESGTAEVSSFHQDAQKVYKDCVEAFGTFGQSGDKVHRICLLSARDFDTRHPNGYDVNGDAGGQEDGGEVEKTISTAGMAADLGSPSAEVNLTDADTGRKRKPRL